VFKTLLGTAMAIICVLLALTVEARAAISPTTTVAISGSVSDATGKPVAGAKVSLSGPRNAETQTDTHGLFVFVGMPPGTYQISVAATGLGTATRTVSVENDIDVAIQYEAPVKVIGIVTTRANAGFNVTSASVTQVTPIAEAFKGKTSWRTLLEQIPGVAQGGLLNGDTQFGTISDSPLVPMQVSIDGALPYETATLFDDMPLMGASDATVIGTGTDLGNYPLNGFSSADVVRGPGANAPSIIDSIGGTFVLRPPAAVNQDHFEFSLSNDAYGGAVENTLAAARWANLSATIVYGFNNSPGPLHGNYPVIYQAGGFSDPVVVNGHSLQPNSPNPSCIAPTPANPLGCQFGSLVDGNFSQSGFPAFYGYQTGLIACCALVGSFWKQHSGAISMNYAISSHINVGAFYAGQDSVMNLPGQATAVNFLPPAGYTGHFPTGMSSVVGARFGLEVYEPQSSSLLEEKITANLGSGTLRVAALQNRHSILHHRFHSRRRVPNFLAAVCCVRIQVRIAVPEPTGRRRRSSMAVRTMLRPKGFR
jgi:Carboxypeptidase regulatory-like domain